MNGHYDVIVIGGGTAGVVAAVQAGRAGAKTLLVEKKRYTGRDDHSRRSELPRTLSRLGQTGHRRDRLGTRDALCGGNRRGRCPTSPTTGGLTGSFRFV